MWSQSVPDRLRRELLEGGAPFSPTQVSQVAAGYFWDPTSATGSDLAVFTIPEGNAKVTHNVITPALATAPAIGTMNGQAIVTYTNQAVADDIARTAAVQRGFTGSMGFGGWINQAVAVGTVFVHGRGGNMNCYIQCAAGSVRVGVHDGVGNNESQFPLPPGGYAAGPFFIWGTYDIAQAAAARIGLSYDTVAQVPNVAATPGTTARDVSDVIALGGSAADSSTGNITGDWSHGLIYITNGLPSADDLTRMFNHRRLK
jgi:hypothetical protein